MFFLTTVKMCGNELDDQRTIGMASDIDTLKKVAETNTYDIYEDGYYNYAVICEVKEGIYQHTEEIQWYHFIGGKPFKMNKNDELKDVDIYILG